MDAASAQAALLSNLRDGNRPIPASLACRIRSSTRGVSTMAGLEERDLPKPVATGVLVATAW